MFKEINIPKLTIIAPIISLSLLTTLITYFFVKNQYEYFEKEIKEIEIEYIENQKKLIKNEIDRVINYMEYKTKFIINKTIESQREIIDRVESIRFGNNGYIFILNVHLSSSIKFDKNLAVCL